MYFSGSWRGHLLLRREAEKWLYLGRKKDVGIPCSCPAHSPSPLAWPVGAPSPPCSTAAPSSSPTAPTALLTLHFTGKTRKTRKTYWNSVSGWCKRRCFLLQHAVAWGRLLKQEYKGKKEGRREELFIVRASASRKSRVFSFLCCQRLPVWQWYCSISISLCIKDESNRFFFFSTCYTAPVSL